MQGRSTRTKKATLTARIAAKKTAARANTSSVGLERSMADTTYGDSSRITARWQR
jgi:hypothetical protein